MARIVFLTGFMGSGKSSLGKKLARRLGYEFLDTDKVIEQQQKMPVQQIFRTQGETAFRNFEHALLLELLNSRSTSPDRIVATGGGMPCSSENTALMRNCGTIIYLQHPAGQLASRLLQRPGKRPLLEGMEEDELRSFVSERLAVREPFYLQADLVVSPEEQQPGTLEEFIRRKNS